MCFGSVLESHKKRNDTEKEREMEGESEKEKGKGQPDLVLSL